MRIRGRLVAAGKHPLAGLQVSVHDVGRHRLPRRRYAETPSVARATTAGDGGFVIDLDDLDDGVIVAVVVRDADDGSVLYASRAVPAGRLPTEELLIDLRIRADDHEDVDDDRDPGVEDARLDPERLVDVVREPAPRPGSWPPPDGPRRDFEIQGRLQGRAPRGATVVVSTRDKEKTIELAAEFVRADGTFTVRIPETTPGSLVTGELNVAVVGPAKAGADGEQEVLFRKSGIVALPGGRTTLGIDLGNRPERDRRPPEIDVTDGDHRTGRLAAERFVRSRGELDVFHRKLIVEPLLKLDEANSKLIDERRKLRQRIRAGEPTERFVPTKRSLATRVADPTFVDGTVGRDERAEGRFLAQAAAAENGVARIAGADRSGLLLDLDPGQLERLRGARSADGQIHVPAETAFDLLKRRFPTAAVRRDIDPTRRAVDRIAACIDAHDDPDPGDPR